MERFRLLLAKGHQWYFQSEEPGDIERRFFETYGNVVRWKGPLGVSLAPKVDAGAGVLMVWPLQEDRLWVADPKGLHHILELSGYLYEKPYAFRERHAVTLDRGLFWAAGG